MPIKQLVPGDIVVLSAGDMIPADCRVLAAKDLFVSQSAMTGESLPVEKFAAAARTPMRATRSSSTTSCSWAPTSCQRHGHGGGRGHRQRTYFGALAQRVTSDRPRHRPRSRSGVNKVSWLLIRFMLVMVPIVLLINGFTKGDWLEAFLFALSVAVGLTPEMLPMIVTSTLAKGAVTAVAAAR